MTDHWRMQRGATVLPGGGVRFSVWAPNAESVAVRLRGRADVPLERRGHGVYEAIIPEASAGTDYQYVLGGAKVRPDPASRHQPEGVHGPSRVVDPSFRWTDARWRGREMADLIIYELHVGTFTHEGTFDGVVGHLDELVHLGVTAIELMPVAQFPGGRNWGYDGVLPYAVQSTYGGPDGLRRLVDAAHAKGLAVILDVVYNHIGPEGNYLGDFGPFFTETYKTPWGPAVNYDGPGSDEVRRYLIDNALYWISEYHIDALRLDAIHGIYDLGATHILREIADACHHLGERLERRVLVIGESDLNDPRVIRTAPHEGHGLDAQWSDDLHHAIHAELTGERAGYYIDFGGSAQIATAIARRFVYDGRFSAHRNRRHGAPAVDLPADRFVVCIQNHDQVGNRAIGDRLATLISFERQKLAAALLLLSPYVPLLFMGEEYGERNPFLYFISHGDAELVTAVRDGRRKEFASFGWGDEVPDPQAEDTFRRSRLGREASATAEGGALRALYRALLELRRTERALRPGDATVSVTHDEAMRTIRLELDASGHGLSALFNLSNTMRVMPMSDTSVSTALLLDTDEARFGGEGRVRLTPSGLPLPPFSAAVVRRGGAAERESGS